MILDVLFLGDDDEDDPLDAYMKNLENQAKTKGIYLFYVLYNNYLWTYDLYGPSHKDFDAGGWITW